LGIEELENNSYVDPFNIYKSYITSESATSPTHST